MQNLSKWTQRIIRENEDMLWLEERKFDWVTLLLSPINAILSGAAVIIVTDNERDWFADYAIKEINNLAKDRPIIPIYKLTSLFPHIDKIKKVHQTRLKDFSDSLDIAFNQHIFWYIGRHDDFLLDFSKKKEDGFYWVFDEESSDSFMLKSFDQKLDFKLLSMCSLFEKTIFASTFGEIELVL